MQICNAVNPDRVICAVPNATVPIHEQVADTTWRNFRVASQVWDDLAEVTVLAHLFTLYAPTTADVNCDDHRLDDDRSSYLFRC